MKFDIERIFQTLISDSQASEGKDRKVKKLLKMAYESIKKTDLFESWWSRDGGRD